MHLTTKTLYICFFFTKLFMNVYIFKSCKKLLLQSATTLVIEHLLTVNGARVHYSMRYPSACAVPSHEQITHFQDWRPSRRRTLTFPLQPLPIRHPHPNQPNHQLNRICRRHHHISLSFKLQNCRKNPTTISRQYRNLGNKKQPYP